MKNNSATSDIAKSNNRKRFTKSVVVYVLAAISGALMGAALALHDSGRIELSEFTIIGMVVIMTIFLSILTWFWYKGMDEFEKASFNQAGNIAFHSGFIALPWFVLNEFGILPTLKAFTLFFIMSCVFLISYYGKKFF